jgi:hypothetical protein
VAVSALVVERLSPMRRQTGNVEFARQAATFDALPMPDYCCHLVNERAAFGSTG